MIYEKDYYEKVKALANDFFQFKKTNKPQLSAEINIADEFATIINNSTNILVRNQLKRKAF